MQRAKHLERATVIRRPNNLEQEETEIGGKYLVNKHQGFETKKTIEAETEELKCELCVFKTQDKTRFTKHMKEIHSVKGKYVCTMCEREFGTRKECNGQKYNGCGGWLVRHIGTHMGLNPIKYRPGSLMVPWGSQAILPIESPCDIYLFLLLELYLFLSYQIVPEY